MIILTAFNKGGIGKTTLAVHVTGVLAEHGRVLLIDGVDQCDSFYFFCRQLPQQELVPQRAKANSQVTAIWNPGKSPLRRLVDFNEYDSIVLDINSPKEDTVQAIAGSQPDLILLPINDQALAMRQLEDTLAVVAAMEEQAGYQCRVRIVPLGVTKTNIYEHLSSFTTKPQNLGVTQRINKHPQEFSKSLQQGEYVWNYLGCEYIRDILQNVVT